MGADLVFYILEMEHGQNPDWRKAEEYVKKYDSDDFSIEFGESKEEVLDYIKELKDWWNGDYPRDVDKIRLKYTDAIVTGGMNYGDLPTEACNILNILEYTGVIDILFPR